MDIITAFKSARRCGTPLVAISTPDEWATIRRLCDAVNGDSPKVEWDFVRGLVGIGQQGRDALSALGPDELDATKNNPVAACVVALKLPAKSILFLHLANRWIADAAVVQALSNLRDEFKATGRTVVLLGPCVPLPAELSNDVVTFDEPLPERGELTKIVSDLKDAAEVALTDETITHAVDAVQGLSAFAAEQVTAMSLTKKGLDLDGLWERKRQKIEATPGLKVFRGGERFDQIGGVGVVKGFLTRILNGNAKPNAIVFVDEIEKMLGGAKGDLSGVTQDQLGAVLSYMQDHAAAGCIFIGPPGAAKSAVAKAAGTESGIPTIQLDLGASKGSLVGQSEQQIRGALKVITAVSNSKSLWIATCNSITELPPELRRRFTLGTFFFDLPDTLERNTIWQIWTEHYGHMHVSPADIPQDAGWTGAEIRQCCDIAWRLGCSLEEAAEFVVPVSRSAADAIDKLRTLADGRFLSASYPGLYRKDRAQDHGAPQLTEDKRPARKRQLALAE